MAQVRTHISVRKRHLSGFDSFADIGRCRVTVEGVKERGGLRAHLIKRPKITIKILAHEPSGRFAVAREIKWRELFARFLYPLSQADALLPFSRPVGSFDHNKFPLGHMGTV